MGKGLRTVLTLLLILSVSALIATACAAPAPSPKPAPAATPTPTVAPKPTPTATATPTPTPTTASSPKPEALLRGIKIGTSTVGTGVYTIAVAMARIAEKYIPGAKASAVPTAGALASMQLLGKGTGEVDSCWAGKAELLQMFSNTSVFAQSPAKLLPYVTWHSNTVEQFVVTKAGRTDINSLADLAGKKVFFNTAGTNMYDFARSVFTGIGLWDKISDRQMGQDAAADALETGAVDAVVGYTMSYKTVPPWLKDLDSRVKIKIVVPTQKEQDAITKLAFTGGTWDVVVKSAFTQNVGVDKIWSWTLVSSSDYSSDVDAQSVYLLVKAFDEHAKELFDMAPTHIAPYEMGLDFQVNCLKEYVGSGIPVHPGMAQYLKEKGKWIQGLTIGEYKKRPGA